MSESVVSVAIRADTAQLVVGMKDAAAAVGAGSQAMAAGLASTSAAAQKADQSHGGLLATLRAFKQEQVQQGRFAKFYAAELTSVIPASAGASSALRGVLGAGLELAAGGGILMAGFELAKVGIEQFITALDRQNDAQLATQKASTETRNRLVDVFSDAARSLGRPLSEPTKLWNEELVKTAKAVRAIDDEIKLLQNDNSVSAKVQRAVGLIPHNDEINKLNAQKAGIQSQAQSPEVEQKFRQADAADRAKMEHDVGQQILSIRAATASSIEKIRLDLKEKINTIDYEEARLGGEAEKLKQALREKAAEETTRARLQQMMGDQAKELSFTRDTLSVTSAIQREHLLRTEQIEMEFLNRKTAADRAEKQKLLNEEQAFTNTQLRLAAAAHDKWVATVLKADEDETRKSLDLRIAYFKDADDKVVAKMKEAILVGQQIGDTLGKSFIDAATGAISFGQAVANVMQQALQAVVNMAIKSLEAYALSAEGAAFFSQAGVPIIGPALGAAAIATTGAIFAGLVGAMPHFAAGGRYSGGPMVVGERGPEIINPSGSGTVIPNHALGGVTINVHTAAADAAGLRRLVSSPDFVRAMREAQRNGVL